MDGIDIEFRREVPHGMVTASALTPEGTQWVRDKVDLGGWQVPDGFAFECSDMANAVLAGAIADGLAVRMLNLGEVHTFNGEAAQ